ncbi:hypothetical protein Ahy_B09g094518 isoform D [Arachis hypogaea]|uniref:Uncharacterized protein n=1 Tax=Arachis hypogaea TaxID=3818 RepID=A0A444XBG0_ARAHY|nr:hypothetical protein Ahy_B09g094518 isoform D [Arachis hypogaea]
MGSKLMLLITRIGDQGANVINRSPFFLVGKAKTFFNGLNGVDFQLSESVDHDPTRSWKLPAEIHHLLITGVLPIQQRLRHLPRPHPRRHPRHPQLHLQILQRLLRLLVDQREVDVERNHGGAGGEEVVDGDSHGGGCVHGGGAEDVDDEGFDGGGLGDKGECGGDVGDVVANEVESPCGEAEGAGGRRVRVGEAVEGDGRVVGGDAVDVGVGGRMVEEAGGKEDGDVVATEGEAFGHFNH